VHVSQAGQDYFPCFHNKEKVFFVDLAANDWRDLSNSYYIETMFGYKGICIEPNPMYHLGLLTNRSCELVINPVGMKNGEVVQFALKNVFGGVVQGAFNQHLKKDNEMTSLYTVTLTTILDQLLAPKIIDFLSLDVEGYETYVMKGFDFDKYRFMVVNVERPDEEFSALLKTHDYVFLNCAQSWGDCWFLHKNLVENAHTVPGLEVYLNYPKRTQWGKKAHPYLLS
jgi:FkbM family methyltransferase